MPRLNDPLADQQVNALVVDLTMIRAQMNACHHEDPVRIMLENRADRINRRITWLCQRDDADNFYLGEGQSRAS